MIRNILIGTALATLAMNPALAQEITRRVHQQPAPVAGDTEVVQGRLLAGEARGGLQRVAVDGRQAQRGHQGASPRASRTPARSAPIPGWTRGSSVRPSRTMTSSSSGTTSTYWPALPPA